MRSTHKVILLGGGGVGKSALSLRFLYDEFVEEYEPTKADCYNKNLTVDEEECQLAILDTAGQEDYEGVLDESIRHSDGFLCVFSITDKDSLDDATHLSEQILRVKHSDAKPPIFLVGNKSDLETERKISVEEAEEIANLNGGMYIETSAKTKLNVDKVFYDMAREIKLWKANNLETTNPKKTKKAKGRKKKKKCTLL